MLVYLFHFIILRFRFQIAEYDTVHNELTVVRSIAEITAISQVAFTGFLVIVVHRLVYPVPDTAALEDRIFLDDVPVVLQIAHTITHRVSIFRNVERIFDVIVAFHSTAHPADGRILVGTHIDDIVVTFILNRA